MCIGPLSHPKALAQFRYLPDPFHKSEGIEQTVPVWSLVNQRASEREREQAVPSHMPLVSCKAQTVAGSPGEGEGNRSDERALQVACLSVRAAKALAEPGGIVTDASARAVTVLDLVGGGVGEAVAVRSSLWVSR